MCTLTNSPSLPDSPTIRRDGRATLRRFALWRCPDGDLADEIVERSNSIARYLSQLADGDYADMEELARLQGGIDFERVHLQALRAEVDRRERAHRYGYRPTGQPSPDLSARFARQRAGGGVALAALITRLTDQSGIRAHDRWHFRCPFHGSGAERTPSLVVFADGRAHCFACGWHGDAPAFVGELKGVGMVEALLLLETGVV